MNDIDFSYQKKNFNQNQKITKELVQFDSQIGQGSFGKVYRVKIPFENDFFALKVLSKNQLSQKHLLSQLQNEIEILKNCNHDNIIELYAVFQNEGYIFLLTELARDGNLYEKLKQETFFNESQTKKIMTDIINAVSYIHSFNPPIIHRDIKPENVLIDGDKLKIADFGWSNFQDEIRNTFCGTPDYLAPEMIIGSGHDEKLDVWGLGVLMYELLHGNPPFTPKLKVKELRAQQKQIESNILKGNVEYRQDLSTQAISAMKIMMNPKKQQRPSAKDLFNLDFFKQKQDKKLLKIIQQKDQIICQKDEEISRLKKQISDMEKRYSSLSQINQDKEEEISNLKNEQQVRRFSQLDWNELSTVKNQLKIQEDTNSYMYKKAKSLQQKVSEFYQVNILNEEKITQDNNRLSFEELNRQLQEIFNVFNKNAFKMNSETECSSQQISFLSKCLKKSLQDQQRDLKRNESMPQIKAPDFQVLYKDTNKKFEIIKRSFPREEYSKQINQLKKINNVIQQLRQFFRGYVQRFRKHDEWNVWKYGPKYELEQSVEQFGRLDELIWLINGIMGTINGIVLSRPSKCQELLNPKSTQQLKNLLPLIIAIKSKGKFQNLFLRKWQRKTNERLRVC